MLKFPIPDHKLRLISEQNLIEKLFLEVLSVASGKPLIDTNPAVDIEYDDYTGEPSKRKVRYGTEQYGIYTEARPILSGVGVHGEEATWKFCGLSAELSVTGYVYLDMRGNPMNSAGIDVVCSDLKRKQALENLFTRSMTRLTDR